MIEIQLETASVSKILRAFEVLQEYGVDCSMEMVVSKFGSDPSVSFSDEVVSAEYVEQPGGDDFIAITAGNTNLIFGLREFSNYGIDVSSNQVLVSIAGEEGAAWFNSSTVPSTATYKIASFKERTDCGDIQTVSIKKSDPEILNAVAIVLRAIKGGSELLEIQTDSDQIVVVLEGAHPS